MDDSIKKKGESSARAPREIRDVLSFDFKEDSAADVSPDPTTDNPSKDDLDGDNETLELSEISSNEDVEHALDVSQPDALVEDETGANTEKPSSPSPEPQRSNVEEIRGTIEDLMRELLQPILLNWLDKNLPSTVERAIEKEIRDKISRHQPE